MRARAVVPAQAAPPHEQARSMPLAGFHTGK